MGTARDAVERWWITFDEGRLADLPGPSGIHGSDSASVSNDPNAKSMA